jgi:hypothetical protein
MHSSESFVIVCSGRAKVQAASLRPFTAEARIRSRVNPCGIPDGQSGTGTGLSPTSSIFSCLYISIVTLHTYSYITWGLQFRGIVSPHDNNNSNNNLQDFTTIQPTRHILHSHRSKNLKYRVLILSSGPF